MVFHKFHAIIKISEKKNYVGFSNWTENANSYAPNAENTLQTY